MASNREQIAALYQSGMSLEEVARAVGRNVATVHYHLIRAGVPRRPTSCGAAKRRIPIDETSVVNRYQAGESENAVALSLGIARNVVRRVLAGAGVELRSQSDAERMKWSRMTASQREAQARAAHDATRGRVRSFDELVKAANNRSRKPMTKGEQRLLDLLAERGLAGAPQFPIGKYNCDAALPPVAVEVWYGITHFVGHSARIHQERTRYLLDAGWHVAVVWTAKGPPTIAQAEYVARFVRAARRDPSMLRQYRMVGREGNVLVACDAQDDDFPLKPPPRNRAKRANGRN